MRKSKLILVVPCYNESTRIPLDVFEDFLVRHDQISVCFVDDGSRDDTRALLQEFVDRNSDVSCLRTLQVNGGKAEAVRHGILEMLAVENLAEYIGFWDADLATPLNQSLEFLALISSDPMLFAVVGSRWPHLGSDIERGSIRNFIGEIMATIITRYLKLNIYDSQCGAKIFRADIARELFRRKFVSRWLFDVEVFTRMKEVFTQRVDVDAAVMMNMHCHEFPLRTWRDVPGSKLGLSNAVDIVFEIIRIAWHYRKRVLFTREEQRWYYECRTRTWCKPQGR